MDIDQLRTSTAVLFGPSIDFHGYLRKFVHRRVNLPGVTDESARRLVSDYINFYLLRGEDEDTRRTFLPISSGINDLLSTIVVAWDMNPRQIQEVFRILGHLMALPPGRQGHILFGYAAVSIFMSALYVASPEEYHVVGRRQMPLPHLSKLLRQLKMTKNGLAFWASILLLAYQSGEDHGSLDDLKKEWIETGVLDLQPSQESFDECRREVEMRYWRTGLFGSPIQKVYDSIERVVCFGGSA